MSADLGEAVKAFVQMNHDEHVARNHWVFHNAAPADMHSYVYRYLDGAGNLLYVGMTSNAAQRARTHWKQSDWVSWVEHVTYKRTRNRDEAYKLESKIRREEDPVFRFTGGCAEIMKKQDAKLRINHVAGACKLPGGACHLATWTRLAKEHLGQAA